jgi:hypothetical protein
VPIPHGWAQALREFVEGWSRARQDGRHLGNEYIGDEPFENFVLTESAASWDAFLAWLNELQGSWCFRGQRDARWFLNTSLDRAVRRHFSSDNGSGTYHRDREPEISELLFRFQQQAHQYIDELPSSDDLSSWFALMQHHGVPTRFLDWTKSAYVALYFAFEEEPAENGCGLWAIDLEWLKNKALKLLSQETPPVAWDDFKERAEYLNGLLGQAEKPVILHIDPLRLDARMVAQQGFFLCKLVHRATFSQILMSMMMHPKTSEGPDTPDRPVVRRLVLRRDLRIGILKNLRAMNISRASLFPGLDGFSQSLRLDLEMKE